MITLKEFLAREVVPALGCTEPGAVALAAARARQELGGEYIERISADVSDSIYKNGMNVGVPGGRAAKQGIRSRLLWERLQAGPIWDWKCCATAPP